MENYRHAPWLVVDWSVEWTLLTPAPTGVCVSLFWYLLLQQQSRQLSDTHCTHHIYIPNSCVYTKQKVCRKERVNVVKGGKWCRYNGGGSSRETKNENERGDEPKREREQETEKERLIKTPFFTQCMLSPKHNFERKIAVAANCWKHRHKSATHYHPLFAVCGFFFSFLQKKKKNCCYHRTGRHARSSNS